MGSFDPIKINQTVELELPNDTLKQYRSKVYGLSDDRIIVAVPVKGGSRVAMGQGSKVKLIYTDSTAVYVFFTTVLSQDNDNAEMVILGKPDNIKKIQRRNFVRLDIQLKLLFCRLDNSFESKSSSFEAVSVDISGGGMMFMCDEVLSFGDILDAQIFFGQNEKIRSVGRVVRVMENLPQTKMKYSVGFEFTMIEELERDKIIKFIFNRQRELRRKGLL
ncbi:flagellar brake protein [Phosphitispora sp. TUW77]|uniref:flagellar brake protein n=1 Tax=Phosphitispora sp. TUW77 TaxID=3152361 RepID=UPI003AB169AA